MTDPTTNDPEPERLRRMLAEYRRTIESLDGGVGALQQSLDDLVETTDNIRRELQTLVPSLESLNRRLRVFSSAIERFVRDVK